MGETPKNPGKQRVVVGISGASGVAYGIRLLEALKEVGAESHLVITKPGEMTMTKDKPASVRIRALPLKALKEQVK